MSANIDQTVIKPSQAKNIIRRAMNINQPIFLWGPPGIGKSDVVKSITDELPGKNIMIDMRLALLEPTDLRGYPFRNPDTNQMEWAPPSDLPNTATAKKYKTVVLFLDELNSAPQSVQAAAYQLILNRRIGQYELPKNVRIVAAGNRQTDRGVTYKMPAPLANRFRHLEMGVNFEDWLDWAILNNIHVDVQSYITFSKNNLFNFNPKINAVAFATPRSWSYVSEIIKSPGFDDLPEDEQRAEVASAIGDETAGEFFGYRRVANKIPDIDEILAGNITELANEQEKTNISLIYALGLSILYSLNEIHRNKSEAVYKKALNHGLRFIFKNFTNPEMVIFTLITMVRSYRMILKMTALDEDTFKVFETYRKFIPRSQD